MTDEFVSAFKTLLDLGRILDKKMERLGLLSNSEYGFIKDQFFNVTLPDLVGACQQIVRGEPYEKAELRLKRVLPAVRTALDKLRKVEQGRSLSADFDEIERLLGIIVRHAKVDL